MPNDAPTQREIVLTKEQRAYQAILVEAVREAELRFAAKLESHKQDEMGRYGELIGAFARQERTVDRRLDAFGEQLTEVSVQTTKLATAQATAGSRAGARSGVVAAAIVTAAGGVVVALLTQCSPATPPASAAPPSPSVSSSTTNHQ